MQNQNPTPQMNPLFGPSTTGEDMVEYQPLAPGSVLTPQEQPQYQAEQEVAQVIPDDGVLESEFMQQQRAAQVVEPESREPSIPKSFSSGPPAKPGGGGNKFSYIVGFALIVFIFLVGGGFLIYQ